MLRCLYFVKLTRCYAFLIFLNIIVILSLTAWLKVVMRPSELLHNKKTVHVSMRFLMVLQSFAHPTQILQYDIFHVGFGEPTWTWRTFIYIIMWLSAVCLYCRYKLYQTLRVRRELRPLWDMLSVPDLIAVIWRCTSPLETSWDRRK